MPVEPKPIFRPDALRPHLSSFQLSDEVAAKRALVQKWAELLGSAQGEKLREQELLADFISEIFCDLLGYQRPADNPARYTCSREKYNEVDGKYADAVLGEFKPDEPDKPIIALEGKGPKDPLERPFAGRKKSAVDQGYGYAINLQCNWIIVTSMRQTRLYHKGSDQQTYERFDVADLANNDAQFRKFVFLLGAERVVPISGECHFQELKESSEKIGKLLTKKFYLEYANIRQDVFELLCQENPNESRHEVLAATQKLLDRVLFTAFCEDRGLLPDETLKRAFEHADPYNPRPIWNNFCGLFKSIDGGNPDLKIPPYNGGLFATDPFLENLTVPDEVCRHFRDIGEYEYRDPSTVSTSSDEETDSSLIDVEILGHIFEQSISDLEQIRNELDGLVEPVEKEKHKTRRKKEGAFYTPEFITRYITEQTLGPVLEDRFEALRVTHSDEASGTARSSLKDPSVYDLQSLNNPQRDALVGFWDAWQEELTTIRILDPACGSGAFLIEAFDQLHTAYQSSNDRLEELRGQRSLFDLDRRILQNNLFGVDLNEEAIQICRLSLWIKTAEKGKTLTSLDDTIRVGNSVVNDPEVHPKAFDWNEAFPDVFANGGFDVVIGNPPYVRQEWLTDYKPHLEEHFSAYHGKADLYVYFYELGIRILKPGGLMSFIVTNKWMKASYGEPLRTFFADETWIESVVDFGHAKQIFEQADVFPSIIVARKPTKKTKPKTTRLCTIPREQLRVDNLSVQIETEGDEMDVEQLSTNGWQLESREVVKLLKKIKNNGVPLSEFASVTPKRGTMTGCNAAFFVDNDQRQQIIATDSKSESIIQPYLRGQDIARWSVDWDRRWMIVMKSSNNFTWPWSKESDTAKAERLFSENFPGIYGHMKANEKGLKKRKNSVVFWWELSSCAFWEMFEQPKIMYQEIQFHPSYLLDTKSYYGNNKTFLLPTDDLYILSVLNSPLMWWHNWRYLPHMKDEALSPVGFLMEQLPIADCAALLQQKISVCAERLVELQTARVETRRNILDWLKVQHGIVKPNKKLQSPIDLTTDEFIWQVRRVRGKKDLLSAAAVRNLRDEYVATIEPARKNVTTAIGLEQRINDLVNEAYGLSSSDIELMWKTAPPRMPIANPK